MSILVVEHLTHGFGGREIFEDVSFRLLKGEHVALVGANGEGKSTFMSIITNTLEPDEGKIIWNNKVRVGYLDQHTVLQKGQTIYDVLKEAFGYLFEAEKTMLEDYEKMADPNCDMDALMEEIGEIQELLDHNDFYLIDSKIKEVSSSLGLADIGLDKDVDDLSGGQRTKVLLTKLLLEKPDILLLDEPTNYLDEDHIFWLKNYLKNYENAFILISHDIPFINEVVNLVYHVENTALTRYVGNYDEFKRIYEINQKQLESAYKRQQQEIAKLEDFVQRNKARVATRGMANSRAKKLDKIERIELVAEKPKPEFHFTYGKTPSKVIFKATDLVIGYESPLSRPMNIEVEKGEKVALVGANGLGKTTLLKSLLNMIQPFDGKIEVGDNLQIAYFKQEEKDDKNLTALEDCWETYSSFSQYEVRSALAKCGLTTMQIESKVRVLSGGEQAKLRLCKLLHNPSNILVLDEPTNHLDQDAKDALAKAIAEYKGTVILVCHESEFYQPLVSRTINLEQFSTKYI